MRLFISAPAMVGDPRFEKAIRAMDERNAADPKSIQAGGREVARELAFARRVYEWVLRLSPSPSEPLLLAARGHTLCRWEVPRDLFPRDRPGYHAWRKACAQHHADVAAMILQASGYDSSIVDPVRDFIVKKNWPTDPAAQVLEDADCLAFLELKLEDYVDEWGQEKTVNILRRTLRKMTPAARELAAGLSLGPVSAELLSLATAKAGNSRL